MKIVIIDDVTGKPFTICDGTNSRIVGSIIGPDDIDIACERKTQEDEPIRAESVVLTPRQNRRTRVKFKTSILQKSISACQVFCLDYDSIVPLSGKVVMTTDVDGGQVTRYILNAMVESVDSRFGGLTSYHSFSIRGSMVVTKSQ